MNITGKNLVKRYFKGYIQRGLSFQFGVIWTKIGGVIAVQS